MSPATRSPLLSRRAFLQAGATGIAAAPALRLTAQGAAREKIHIGFMGLNSRGTDLVREFLATERVAITWLCDVDRRALEKAGEVVRAQQTAPFKTTTDFRQALEDRRLQALVIAAPDHWHAPAAILAAQAGKHVYVEKPLSHNPREGERLVEAVKKARVVAQVGLQRRSTPWVIEAVQRVQRGELGPVPFARAWYAARREGIGRGQLAPVPEWLDYSLWQGPAPERPFRHNLVHYNWHWFWHWGTGELGNNGVHFLDVARWALQLDCPNTVTSAGARYAYDDDQESPDVQAVTYQFDRCTLSWEHRSCIPVGSEGEATGLAFHGRDATLILGASGYRIVGNDGKELAAVKGPTPTRPHADQFLDCIETPGKAPAASVEDGHRSTLLCLLGNIAQRTGELVRVNAKSRQLTDAALARRFWSREYRPGWEPKG